MENADQLEDLRDFDRSPELAGLPDYIIEDAIKFLEVHPELNYKIVDLSSETLIKSIIDNATPHFQDLFQVYLLRRAVKDRIAQQIAGIHFKERWGSVQKILGDTDISEQDIVRYCFIGIMSGFVTFCFLQALFNPELGIFRSEARFPLIDLPPEISAVATSIMVISMAIALYFRQQREQKNRISEFLEENTKEIPHEIESCYELVKHIFKLKKLQLEYSQSLDSKKVKQSAMIGAMALQNAQKVEEYAAAHQQIFEDGARHNEELARDNEWAAKPKKDRIKLEDVDLHLAILDLSLTMQQSVKEVRFEEPANVPVCSEERLRVAEGLPTEEAESADQSELEDEVESAKRRS